MPKLRFLQLSLRWRLGRLLCLGSLLLGTEALAQGAGIQLVPFRRGTRWGYANRNRRLVLPLAYTDAGPFVGVLAWVRQGPLYGYIDASGNPITPVHYGGAGTFSPEGHATVVLPADTFDIGPTGHRLTTPPGPAPDTDYSEQGDLVRRQGKEGFRFSSGSRTVVPAGYDERRALHHDGLLVHQGPKWGALNAKSKLLLPLEYNRGQRCQWLCLPHRGAAGPFRLPRARWPLADQDKIRRR